MQKIAAILIFALLILQVTSTPWLQNTPAGAVFLLLGGKTARIIPEMPTYNHLCLPNAWTNIPWTTWYSYTTGPKLDPLAVLVQGTDMPEIYLLEGGIRYLIANSTNFNNYGFNSAAIRIRDPIELQKFPLSPTII